MQKYLWGNVPAVDMLNSSQNEGGALFEQLRLLFAGAYFDYLIGQSLMVFGASGNIRNVVQSVSNIRTSYTGHCEIIMNDRNLGIVVRNAILLLIALHVGPKEAAPMMLHIWYSALIPANMFQSLKNKLLPILQEVCTKIQSKPAKSMQAKTWTVGDRSMSLVLHKAISAPPVPTSPSGSFKD
jgi:hypothetical protein